MKPRIQGSSALLFAVFSVLLVQHPSYAQHEYCDRRAQSYARRYASGGLLEGAAEGALSGLVLGGIFGGRRGLGTGAAIGGAFGAISGGAQQHRDERILYDRAYRECRQEQARSRRLRYDDYGPAQETLIYRYRSR